MGGLLDVFGIGFESDDLKKFEADLKNNERELDKYEKKVKETEKALEELKKQGKEDSAEFKKLQTTLEESKKQVDYFSKSVKTMQSTSEFSLLKVKQQFYALGKTIARLAIVGVAVKKSLDFYEQGEQLQFLAQKASISTDNLQLLSNAVRRYGGTAEGVAGSIENLRNQYQQLRMGQGGGALEQAAFKYGVSISSNPEQMLMNIARRMESLKSDAAKWDLANTLGLDEGTARLVMQGTKALTEELKRAQKYKLYTKEDIERMREYRQISLDIRMGIDSIFASIARMLLPAITKVSKVIRAITDWAIEHEGAVKIVATIVIVTSAVLALRGAIGLLTGATAFFGKTLFATPIFWIIAGITALIVVINDFIVFLQGGESIIGEILKKMGVNTEKLRKDIISFFKELQNWIKTAINWLKELGDKFEDVADKVKDFWEKVPEPFKKILGMQNPFLGTFTMITSANELMGAMANNQLNPVPIGAQSAYYSTESRNYNSTNTGNRILNNSNNSKNANIHTMNINVQTNNPKDFAKDFVGIVTNKDNGMQTGW